MEFMLRLLYVVPGQEKRDVWMAGISAYFRRGDSRRTVAQLVQSKSGLIMIEIVGIYRSVPGCDRLYSEQQAAAMVFYRMAYIKFNVGGNTLQRRGVEFIGEGFSFCDPGGRGLA